MSHYFSAPALSWNVMLNMTKLEFFHISDIYLFCEKGMRSQGSYISTRDCKTNKKYLKSFDQNKK